MNVANWTLLSLDTFAIFVLFGLVRRIYRRQNTIIDILDTIAGDGDDSE